ncbi:DNA polymerase IV [Methylotuvimicrobium alcaliphilum]|uniref:DNA polymerase IV n=1 Tax=Methylotuvimicrobium alcaliphilum (strain DSM 19304 / NCIMB 14124 / VKM B-2133 / 20Z) TaxID=1091494 RepID=G4SVE7_META2|nr:DNA polymerase IV [Methylotuvimicrobium alcaliphilum]CCE22919.1 DNA polymerase IV [Methylotuvimicrobium alcaliphilum 20Z]
MEAARKIIHIDMDAFFAAVEQRDFPQYRNKPLIVGGLPGSRGVVSTCSYEARQYGIHSAMPSTTAHRLCPHAIFVKPRFEAYRDASNSIRKIFADYTDLFEPLSLDEAYLDVSQCNRCKGSATLIAKDIKAKIKQQTGLTASAGVSYNKFLAKIASDLDKPDGLYLITPDDGPGFIETLPIGKFHGIGKATEKKMHDLGILTGADLKTMPLASLQDSFGKAGLHYYHICRGIDNRPVNHQRITKSIGVEVTFQEDLDNRETLLIQLQNLLSKALGKAKEKKLAAYTLTIKIKYSDFVQITRSRTLSKAITENLNTLPLLDDLLKTAPTDRRKVRLLGVALSSLASPNSNRQIDLFEQFQ